MQKFIIILIFLFLFQFNAYSGTTVFCNIQSINSSFDSKITKTLEFLGLSIEHELIETWLIKSDILFSYYNLSYYSISLGYKILDNYNIHLEPYLLIGLDSFFSNIELFKFSYHIGFGLNYGFDNSIITSLVTKVYIGTPFQNEYSTFNTGTLGLNLGIGYRF